MAIKLKSLERISKTFTEQSYIYKDLSLDLTQTTTDSPGYTLPVPGTDIKASFDLAAIKNSLQNLFNTRPGQRFLFPTYGLNLSQFLFEPITEANGNIIGNKIFSTVGKFEPRIRVKNVQVILDPDNNQYLINIFIEVPELDIETTIDTIFDLRKQSFFVLPQTSTRNIF